MALIKMQEHYMDYNGDVGGSSSSRYDIAVDTEKMATLITDQLGANADALKLIWQVRESLYRIFSLINTGFGEAWNDDGYRQFAESCNSYADSVYGIVSFMEKYSSILNDVLETSRILTNSVSTVVEDCEAGR